MRNLRQFQKFDFNVFMKDKKIIVSSCNPLKDKDGTKIDLLIVKDDTKYDAPEGKVVTNLHEKITVKVLGKKINLPVNTEATVVNGKATVYGDYNHLLSVYADDVVAVSK